MAESEKAPEQQQAPAKAEGIKNDSAATPPAEEQQPKQIIGEFENKRKTNPTSLEIKPPKKK